MLEMLPKNTKNLDVIKYGLKKNGSVELVGLGYKQQQQD